jgi:diacylglycerol kinase
MISEWAEPAERPKPPRRWKDKFREAFRGMKRGVRGQSSFFVHFFFAVLAIAAAIALDCSLVEWCLLIFCIGGVLTAELFNSSIEMLFKGLDEAARNRHYHCLDIAAGAVLVASMTALLVGAIIFINRFVKLIG